jgi:hypothetical protein
MDVRYRKLLNQFIDACDEILCLNPCCDFARLMGRFSCRKSSDCNYDGRADFLPLKFLLINVGFS